MSSGHLSESILQQYYPHVENLDSYLTFILCPVSDPAASLLGHAFKPHGRDSLAYSSLVNTTLVATQNREKYQGAFKVYKPPVEMDMLHVCTPLLVMVF
jgi:hypothetical protein